jgi:hypothetical protein
LAACAVFAAAPQIVVSQNESHPPVLNDDIATATEIATTPFVSLEDVTDARHIDSTDPIPQDCMPEWLPGEPGWGSVWFTITPDAIGSLSVDTFGSNYDTIISVWAGEPGDLKEVACNNDSSSHESWIFTPLTPGVRYYIMVAHSPEDGELAGNSLVLHAAPVDVPRLNVEVAVTDVMFEPTLAGIASGWQESRVTNLGSMPIIVANAQASGPFETALECSEPIASGQSCSVAIRFNPREVGLFAGELQIRYLGYEETSIVSIRGEGTALVLARPERTHRPLTLLSGQTVETTFAVRASLPAGLIQASCETGSAVVSCSSNYDPLKGVCVKLWSKKSSSRRLRDPNSSAIQLLTVFIRDGHNETAITIPYRIPY